MTRGAVLALAMCGLTTAAFFATRTSSPGGVAVHDRPEAREELGSTQSSDELLELVRELEGRLREKENTVRTLSVAARAALDSAPAADPSTSEVAEADFARVLRARMSESLSRVEGADEARLFDFVSSPLGRALDAKLVCGGSLCEVSLASEDEKGLAEGLKALASAGSKSLPVQLVVEGGERVGLFLATDEEALRQGALSTDDRPEPTVVEWPSDSEQTRGAEGEFEERDSAT